mmetsp:Transcript_79042/g.218782  ORF Transcript_79042/g.218782 Transcript_79042/m.218782 type:complete len:119 (+) Transcript_79042:64-420(+)
MDGPEGDGDGPQVVEAVPMEVFAEGLRARRSARQLLRSAGAAGEALPEADCREVRARCEGAFRTMRDAYLSDCREQTRRCNRLRDLLEECQTSCEAALQRCRVQPPPGTLWERLAARR